MNHYYCSTREEKLAIVLTKQLEGPIQGLDINLTGNYKITSQ